MTKKIEVFASEALPGELEDFPDIKRGWGATKESTGGIPPMKWFNAIQKRTDETINDIIGKSIDGYTFKEGGTVNSKNDWFEKDGSFYYYSGDYPHVVTPESSPDSKWVKVGADIDYTDAITIRNKKVSLRDYVSILDFDGVFLNDKTKDSTDGINKALSSEFRCIHFPSGIYRVDGTVMTKANRELVFDYDAKLVRMKEYSDSTDPVFILRGHMAKSSGGQFITENNHPKGVVMCGHKDLNDTENSLWWRFLFPIVKGVKSSGNIGINIINSQAVLNGGNANYFGFIENPIVQNADEGIVLGEISNGHNIVSPQIYGCISAGVSMYGAYGNMISGGFLHTGENGIIGVNIRNKRFGESHDSTNNQVYGFGIEPGGSNSKAIYIDSNCRRNKINVMGNVAGGNVILNENNDYDTLYSSLTDRAKFNQVSIGNNLSIGGYSTLFNRKTNVKEGDTVHFYRVKIKNGNGIKIKLTLTAENKSLDSIMPVEKTFFISNRVSLVISDVNTIKTDSNSCGDIIVSESNGDVLVSAKAKQNGTGTTFLGFSVSIEIVSHELFYPEMVVRL